MKNKTKKYLYDDIVASYGGKAYKIAVYAEVAENDELDGIFIQRVKFGAKSGQIVSVDQNPIWVDAKEQTPTRTRIFNMGFALYNMTEEEIPYSKETAIKIAKRRFAKSPMTTQNMRFLNEDMVMVIIKNEANFIADNIHLFLPKGEPSFDTCCNDELPLEFVDKALCDCTEEPYTGKQFKYWRDTKVNSIVDFNDGEYIVFEKDGMTHVGCLKEYNPEEDTAVCYWTLNKTSGKENYALHWNCIVDCPKHAIKYEIDIIGEILKNKFHKVWNFDDKKFKLIF